MSELRVGLEAELCELVDERNSTSHLSGEQVYTTPHLIAQMEHTCMKSVHPLLPEGQATVGVGINMRHLAGSPRGMTVRCKSVLVEVKRRILQFEVEAWDEFDKVGEGTHWRAIVNLEEAAARTRDKAQRFAAVKGTKTS